MSKILEMRQKRAELWDAAKAFLTEHQDENNTLSAEDAAIYDKMEADVVNLGKDIERLERQIAIDRELNTSTATPLTSRPTIASWRSGAAPRMTTTPPYGAWFATAPPRRE